MRTFCFSSSRAKAYEDPNCVSKRKDDKDEHSHPSTIIERNYEPPRSLVGDTKEEAHMEEHPSLLGDFKIEEELVLPSMMQKKNIEVRG